MKRLSVVKFAGLSGIAAALFGLCAVFAATILAGESFSWSVNALSDLGVSQVANLFNYSLILTGILVFIFAVGFLKAHAKNALFYLGGALLMLGGTSLLLVGVFTEAYGDLHTYVSLGYFLLFPTAMILVGFAFLRVNMKSKGHLSILVGLIALLVILGGITPKWHAWLGLGFAVPEFVEAAIIAAWTVWMGVSLMRLSD